MKKTFRLTDARPDPQREVRDELRFHLDMRTQEFIEQGMTPEDARRAATASFGDVTSIEDQLPSERGPRELRAGRRERWSSVVQDVRLS